jgi:hypothetical protein
MLVNFLGISVADIAAVHFIHSGVQDDRGDQSLPGIRLNNSPLTSALPVKHSSDVDAKASAKQMIEKLISNFGCFK